MSARRLLCTLSLLLAAACSGGPATGAVGGECSGDERTCDAELQCRLDYPGTLCTRACDAVRTCPEGAACAVDALGGAVCGSTCEDDGDCREGYACAPASDGTTRVCKVQLP